MPMYVVKWCRSHTDLKDAEISFHEFPRNEVRRIKWTAAVRLERGFATIAVANNLQSRITSAYNYFENIGIPEAERIRRTEDEYLHYKKNRIVGGSAASTNQFPYQAGLVIELVGIDGLGVCGASLINDKHLVTAAHCWFDGQNQASKFTVVLGSVTLFTGGTWLQTSNVKAHPSWNPNIVLNDVARIVLPSSVSFSNTILPIKLPSGSALKETFADVIATASGFGKTSDTSSITTGQFLSHVNLTVILNYVCSLSYPGFVQSTNICTSGNGGTGPCGGDSGGPLVYKNSNQTILIGIVSFGSAFGCSIGFPSAYSRVTSFLDFIQGNCNKNTYS